MLMLSAALMAATVAGVMSDQFDLVCHGDESVFFGATHRWGSEPFVERIHVDLVNGLFCSDSCPQLRRMHRVSATEYALLDASDGARHYEKKVIQRVPTGGEGAYYWNYEGQNTHREGVCLKASFTPFPAGTPIMRAMNDPPKPWVQPD